jgi:acyl-coenzyme A thioesterase PaaI-like protein
MDRFASLVDKAARSRFYLWLLNRLLLRKVPFNAPHYITVTKIAPGRVEALLPYRKQNLNHIKGIHACALATLCEYVSGLSLTTALPGNRFRIIMKSIRMEYLYQARMDVSATAQADQRILNDQIIIPLESADSGEFMHEVPVSDISGNHICTATVLWQFKKWEKVRTQ